MKNYYKCRGKIRTIVIIVLLLAVAVAAGVYYHEIVSKPEPSPSPAESPLLNYDDRILAIGIDSRPSAMIFHAVNHYLPKDAYKLKPVIIENPNQRWEMLANGDIDLAVSSLPETVLGMARHNPGYVICFTSTSDGGEGFVTRNSITSLKDLHGRKICAVEGSSGHYFLVKLLNSESKSTAEIDFIPALEYSNAYKFFTLDDSLDGVVLCQPYLSLAHQGNNNLLADSRGGFSITEAVTVGRFAQKHRSNDVQLFVNAYYELVDFINKNPGLAKKLLSTRSGMTMEQVEMLFETTRLKSLDEARAPAKESIVEEMKKIQQVWSIEGLPNADLPVDFEKIYNTTYLENAEIRSAAPIFEGTDTVDHFPVEIPTKTPVEPHSPSPVIESSPVVVIPDLPSPSPEDFLIID